METQNETEIVSIGDDRHGLHMNDFYSKEEFIGAMELWYAENNYQLPSYEDFGDFYDGCCAE